MTACGLWIAGEPRCRRFTLHAPCCLRSSSDRLPFKVRTLNNQVRPSRTKLPPKKQSWPALSGIRCYDEFEKWLGSQAIFTPADIDRINSNLLGQIRVASAGELQGTDDRQAKLKVLNGRDFQDAQQWLGEYLSVFADGVRRRRLQTLGFDQRRKYDRRSIGRCHCSHSGPSTPLRSNVSLRLTNVDKNKCKRFSRVMRPDSKPGSKPAPAQGSSARIKIHISPGNCLTRLHSRVGSFSWAQTAASRLCCRWRSGEPFVIDRTSLAGVRLKGNEETLPPQETSSHFVGRTADASLECVSDTPLFSAVAGVWAH